MKKLIIAMAILVVAGEATALAQSRKNNMGSTDNPDRSTVQAPVGHRQPRAGDVPDEKNLSNPDDAMNKEDAALDRKIKSICRGC